MFNRIRYITFIICRSRGSSVGIAANFGLDGRDSFPGRGKRFFLHSVQTGSGALPASYRTGTSALSLGVKRPEREASADIRSV
jgi:hypothetical protein